MDGTDMDRWITIPRAEQGRAAKTGLQISKCITIENRLDKVLLWEYKQFART